ncbi:hypothetical protein E4U42_003771 [Claviceps africana]|uniref:Uncharacterized protein n=1 Tax=Claviceps africana TaxID=83212 RepID=A0A8K0J6B5_9HYPO|nr:hypothetical protein E4U42_003771 [Claviceps africana]
MANYASGLRVVDASSVVDDPTGRRMREVAHFDCWPEDDHDPEVAFYGAWSSYIWFASGTVVLNCIERDKSPRALAKRHATHVFKIMAMHSRAARRT